MTLEELRTSTGKSREDVAALLGFTYHGIRRIELGGDTPVSTLERYAQALGVPFTVAHYAYQVSRQAHAKDIN